MQNDLITNVNFLDIEQRILVISPHADDEVYGCGGYLVKASRIGAKIHIVYVHVGDVSHRNNNQKIVLGKTRLQEVEDVTNKIKATHEVFYRIPEKLLSIDTLGRRELINKMEEVIGSFKPTQVFIPTPSFNQDHETVYKAGLAACRPPSWEEGFFVKKVFIYNSHKIGWENSSFKPNFFFDISDVIEERNKLIRLYKSQLRCKTFLSVEHIMDYNRCRGREHLMEYAEEYEIRRLIL